MIEHDAELVGRIRAGDAAAFETLMRRHFRMVYLIAFAHVQDRMEAEDVCQETFIRCWEHIAECREPARVGAWIATIVRNKAHNRREFLGVRRGEPLEPALGIAAASRSDERALRSLSAVQREVVLLHDLEGWKHEEVAARIGISIMTSRRHLTDARRRLREILRDLDSLELDHD